MLFSKFENQIKQSKIALAVKVGWLPNKRLQIFKHKETNNRFYTSKKRVKLAAKNSLIKHIYIYILIQCVKNVCMYICAVPLADNTSKKDLVDKMY